MEITLGCIIFDVVCFEDDDCFICCSLKYLHNDLDNRMCAIQAKSNNSNRIKNCTAIGCDHKSYILFGGMIIDIILAIEDITNAPMKVRGTTAIMKYQQKDEMYILCAI